MEGLKGSRVLGLIAAAAVGVALWVGPAAAAPCSVGGAWNPDPTSANMTDCGPGLDGNDSAAEVTTAINNGSTFALWDKDTAASETDGTNPDDANPSRDPSFFFTGSSSGFWFWNATNSIADGNTVFALVLKDGSTANDPIRWAWFLLDNANPTAGGCVLPGGFTHCGTWSMYGEDGRIKSLGHMAMYGAAGPPILEAVPNPFSLVLVGVGLVGIGAVTRRRLTN